MTIQSVMLISLGGFVTCIVAMLLAPVYGRRADRLASERVRRSLPVSMDEIRADKDRLKAKHAIDIHRLETRAEEARLSAARQRVEMNRRDAKICALEEQVTHLRGQLEEHLNARRVLEHNISDRIPKVMERLDRAHKLIVEREGEIEDLNAGTQRGRRALEEAKRLNVQQRSEIDRLQASLATRSTNRYATPEARSDSEIALRSELESLRARTRDQAGVILRLQDLVSKYADATTAVGNGLDPEKELAAIRRDLSDARATLQLAGGQTDAGAFESERGLGDPRETASLKKAVEDQSTEIKRLKAALDTYEGSEKSEKGGRVTLRDTRIAAKARINSLQAQVTSQDDTIKWLRAELAAGNERLARLAAKHRDEMRRLGSGTRPTTGEIHRLEHSSRRPTLSERISPSQRPAAASSSGGTKGGSGVKEDENPATESMAREDSLPKGKVAQFLKAMAQQDDNASVPAGAPSASVPPGKTATVDKAAANDAVQKPADKTPETVTDSTPGPIKAGTASDDGKTKSDDTPSKPRLMDRIAGLGRG